MSFAEWWDALLKFAVHLGADDAIDIHNPESYLEYWEDGDSPEDCFFTEIETKIGRLN
jgi:hypothetical protein